MNIKRTFLRAAPYACALISPLLFPWAIDPRYEEAASIFYPVVLGGILTCIYGLIFLIVGIISVIQSERQGIENTSEWSDTFVSIGMPIIIWMSVILIISTELARYNWSDTQVYPARIGLLPGFWVSYLLAIAGTILSFKHEYMGQMVRSTIGKTPYVFIIKMLIRTVPISAAILVMIYTPVFKWYALPEVSVNAHTYLFVNSPLLPILLIFITSLIGYVVHVFVNRANYMDTILPAVPLGLWILAVFGGIICWESVSTSFVFLKGYWVIFGFTIVGVIFSMPAMERMWLFIDKTVESVINSTKCNPNLAVDSDGSLTCGACSCVNSRAAIYCEQCGSLLCIKCPECGRNKSTGKPCCVACGTNTEHFLAAEKALGQISHLAMAKEWGNILALIDSLPNPLAMAGEHGIKLRQALGVEERRAREGIVES